MSKVDLSVIIPTKDRGEVFEITLNALIKALEGIVAEIIVVNDSKISTIGTDVKHPFIKIIDNPKSGVASARNIGVKNSLSDIILFLDDDIIVNKENITTALHLVHKFPHSAFNLNWIYPHDLTEKIKKTQFGRYLIHYGFSSLKGWHKDSFFDEKNLFEANFVASYFLIMNKSDFIKLGTYNETFPHAGAEDFEFAKRLKNSAIKGYCYPLSTVYHNESDRVILRPWLERKERSAETRKVAIQLGLSEMQLITSKKRAKMFLRIYEFKFIVFALIKLIPNSKFFDTLYFKIVSALGSVYLHKGYFNKRSD